MNWLLAPFAALFLLCCALAVCVVAVVVWLMIACAACTDALCQLRPLNAKMRNQRRV